MTATFFVGDAIEVMGKLPEKSVDLILTSPPFLALRSYLPADHPDKGKEIGSEPTPGEYVDRLIDVVEACDRVLAPHGSMCIELGDTYAGSGGAGGDYDPGGWREGQEAFEGSGKRYIDSKYERIQYGDKGPPIANLHGKKQGGGSGWPLAKSLSLIPELFRLTLVYGTNPLTGRTTERWRLRNVVRWVRPNPPVGALGDKFRPATSELMVFCKSAKRYFDLDAVREPHVTGLDALRPREGIKAIDTKHIGGNSGSNPAGAPPLDWWNIPLVEDVEPTRYGPKEPTKDSGVRRKPTSLAANPSRGDYGDGIGELMSGSNPLGTPPLDWWNIPLSGESQLCRCQVRYLDSLTAGEGIPFDWWNIPPGGYEGAHYAVFPPELCIKPIKAMCPEKVCRVCGEPSRRIVKSENATDERQALADYLRSQREAAGVSVKELAAHFPSVSGGMTGCVWNWENAANVPTAEQWPILKGLLALDDRFDMLVTGERTWTESEIEYRDVSDAPSGWTQDGNGRVYQRLATRKDRIAPDRFSDCDCLSPYCNVCDGTGIQWCDVPVPAGQPPKQRQDGDCRQCQGRGVMDKWRPGLVLDPFVGSGTTLMVATGHGRDAIGIDLDSRNYDLALERVGPFILERG